MSMTLDDRIYEDRRIIFNCFSAEDAKKYVGQKGFFADEIHAYQDLDKTDLWTLDRVDGDEVPFKAGSLFFPFFLPAAFVRPVEEKKLRPFTKEEFLKRFDMGRPIRYRRKGDPKSERRSIFIGYYVYAVDRSDDDLYEEKIVIGLCDYTLDGLLNYYTLDSLFNDYEFFSYVSVKWCPFGTENNKEAARVIFTSIPRGCSKSLFCDLDLKEVDVEKNNEE